jgi:hypothetical protein
MQEHIEAVLAALGLKPVWGGTAMSIGGWLFSSAGAAWCGAVIAFVGLFMNWHYSRRKDRREQEEHDARMRGML